MVNVEDCVKQIIMSPLVALGPYDTSEVKVCPSKGNDEQNFNFSAIYFIVPTDKFLKITPNVQNIFNISVTLDNTSEFPTPGTQLPIDEWVTLQRTKN